MASLLALIRRYVADEPYRRLSSDDLWARFRDHRDEAAFRVFLEQAGPKVFARCRAILQNEALAEEAFQTAFVELVRKRACIPNSGAAVAWVLGTATNVAKAAARRDRRATARDRARAAPEATTDADSVLRQDDHDAVHAALVNLPIRERQALELVYLEGLTHADAAVALGWSRGSVGKYVQRGLDRLRSKLGLAAAGGVAATETALRAAPPALPAARCIDWSKVIWAQAAATTVGRGGFATMSILLTAGAGVAGGLTVWLATPTPVEPPTPPVVAAPPTVPEANRTAFEAVVRPRLQSALDELVVGDGRAVITEVVTRGTVVQVGVELHHGLPQKHVSRLELLYCTHRRFRLFQLDAWGTGRYQNANPKDPVTLALNRVGVPDLTRPTTGLREVEAALQLLPTDPRGEAVEREYRTALARVAQMHAGDWLVRGDPDRPMRVGMYKAWDWPVAFRLGPRVEVHPSAVDLRWATDGRVKATCGDLGGVLFSIDGTRIDFPRTGEWWERPAGYIPMRGRNERGSAISADN